MSVFSALLTNGPLLMGPLADRGTFDQYATYRPGNIVVDDGVVYLNTVPIGAGVDLEDTFDRRDQEGWGQSSHGEVWQTSLSWSYTQPPVIRDGRGIMQVAAETASHGQLLGPATAHANDDLLALLEFTLPVSGDPLGLMVDLNTDEGSVVALGALVKVAVGGSTTVAVHSFGTNTAGANTADEVGPTLADGQGLWLRLRKVGNLVTATLWLQGQPEPAEPQATQNQTGVLDQGHPLVNWTSTGPVGTVAVRYLSVRPLTAADAPADDPDHWVALSDALQVPQPY